MLPARTASPRVRQQNMACCTVEAQRDRGDSAVEYDAALEVAGRLSDTPRGVEAHRDGDSAVEHDAALEVVGGPGPIKYYHYWNPSVL